MITDIQKISKRCYNCTYKLSIKYFVRPKVQQIWYIWTCSNSFCYFAAFRM